MSTFEAAIPVIMAHEGTDTNFWVDDPADPGGETVWGWSMLTIKRLGLTPHDLGLPHRDFFPGCLKAVSKETCRQLYRRYFWNQYGYQNVVDQTAATKMMDSAVNMGPKRAAEFAQRACNTLGASPALKVDGQLGAKSFAAINACDPEDFVRAFGDEMTAYYERIIVRNPALAKFRKNWLRRATWGVKPKLAPVEPSQS
jgi:lysozyme family protein